MQDVHGFMGVHSSDDLISPTFYPSYIIANFSRTYETGTHFIAILFLKKHVCIYFDPLNLSFIPKNINEYIHNNSKLVYHINYAIQSPLSIFCGFFCLLPIMFHVNNIPLLKGITSFCENSEQNDQKCVEMLEKLIKLYYHERTLC